jgi:hypothetical protein
MGWGRAGWYTYRWVDRLLFPANGPSADRILPEHQRLAIGDQVPDGPPEADCWFTVERLEPGRLLALRSTRHLPASWRERGLAMDWIWSWQLDEPVPGRTRVIQRNRMRLRPAWFERAFPGHDRPGGLHHGPQPPARPQAPGSGLRVVGGQEPEELTDRGPVAQRGDAGVALAGVQP